MVARIGCDRAGEPPVCQRPRFSAQRQHDPRLLLIETKEDLLAAWYSGTGDVQADDVVIGRVATRGKSAWGPSFSSPTPGYPRLNPALRRPTSDAILAEP